MPPEQAYLFEKGVNPPIVSSHEPQGVEVADHGTNHAWYPCHCFQEQDPSEPLVFRHIGAISSHNVKGNADC
jgi:hypothetical protein